jgi:hypothetical protein
MYIYVNMVSLYLFVCYFDFQTTFILSILFMFATGVLAVSMLV